MIRLCAAFALVAASLASPFGGQRPGTGSPSDVAGTWVLNRALSEFSNDIGFGMDILSAAGSRGDGAAGFGGVSPRPSGRPASEIEARNSRQLVAEVKKPATRLTIGQTPDAVTVADESGRTRTFHTDGREDSQALDAGPTITTASWDGSKLVVRYRAEPGREVRYTYSRRSHPPQLVVRTELVERGGHDTVTRIYDPAPPASHTAAAPPGGEAGAPSPAGQAAPARPEIPAPLSRVPAAPERQAGGIEPPGGLVPAVPDRAQSAQLDQRPGAELAGLTRLGIVVEGLGPDAARCGLKEDALEAAAVKIKKVAVK